MTDLAIIGGGPAGYVAAERAGAKGLSVTLFEKNNLGGVCLNEGCVPTKTLLYSAKVYDYARHGDKYGVTTEGATFDYGKIVARKNKVVRKLVAGIGASMKAHGVNVVKGEARITGRKEDGTLTIACNGETYEAKNLLLCTGSEAFVPPIPGVPEAGDVIVTNREILALKERPQSIVIIGGGVIGMEFASFYNSLGTEVTVVEMLPEILGGLDGEVSVMLREVYAKRGIQFRLSCKVTEVRGNEVIYVDAEGNTASATGEKILMSVGRRAVTANLGLETIGVEMERGAVRTDAQLRTNVPNVFAAGDINTEIWFVALGSQVDSNEGIRAFLSRHAAEMRGAVIVNLEALGAGEISYVEKEGAVLQSSSSSRMKRYLRRAGQSLGVSIKGASIEWKDSASSYALRHHMQGIGIVGMEGDKPAGCGEAGDTVEAVDPALLSQNTDVVIELLKNI